MSPVDTVIFIYTKPVECISFLMKTMLLCLHLCLLASLLLHCKVSWRPHYFTQWNGVKMSPRMGIASPRARARTRGTNKKGGPAHETLLHVATSGQKTQPCTFNVLFVSSPQRVLFLLPHLSFETSP